MGNQPESMIDPNGLAYEVFERAHLTAPDLPIESTDALDRAGHMSRMKIEDIEEISDFFNTSLSLGDTENLINSYYSEQQQEAITSSIVESVIESFAPTGTGAVMRSDMEVEGVGLINDPNDGGTADKNYLINNSEHSIYFKPETTMTIDGVEYKNDGSYELKPGETWKYGIDGVSAPHLVKGKVYKVSTGSTVVVTNDDIDYTSAGFKSWAGNVLQGGWLGESWLKNISADRVVHTTSNIFGSYTTTTDRPNGGDKSWINLFQSSGLPNTSQYRGFYIYHVGGFLMK